MPFILWAVPRGFACCFMRQRNMCGWGELDACATETTEIVLRGTLRWNMQSSSNKYSFNNSCKPFSPGNFAFLWNCTSVVMHCNLKCIVTEIQFSITSDKSFEKYRYFILLMLEKKRFCNRGWKPLNYLDRWWCPRLLKKQIT